MKNLIHDVKDFYFTCCFGCDIIFFICDKINRQAAIDGIKNPDPT